MKIRNGFVSNSSSSSFLITWDPEKLTSVGLVKNKLEEVLNVPGNHPLREIYDEVTEKFKSELKTVYKTKEDLKNDYCDYEEGEDDYGETDPIHWINKGWHVSEGSFYDDEGDVIEAMLCNMDINYDSPELKIIHNGSY
jgi:hypothetical protein